FVLSPSQDFAKDRIRP
ncbi:hypothetical protein VCHENC02_2044B, partial [Vibrio harveyi]